jgi:maleylacetoacetate isomerase/maleylpyruvate isomerase
MTNDFTLYTYYRSSTAYRTRIALNVKGIVYKQHPVHLLEGGGQQHQPEYKALNPAGEVPTLVHNGRALSQSFAIIEYLDELVPDPKLLPLGAFERAKVRQICEHINCGIHPIANLKIQQYLTREFRATEEQKNQWVTFWITQGMDALELLLTKTAGTFAFGDSLTIADLFVVPQVFSSKRFGVTLEKYPIIRRVNEAAMKLEAINKAHPHLQPDTPSELFGRL